MCLGFEMTLFLHCYIGRVAQYTGQHLLSHMTHYLTPSLPQLFFNWRNKHLKKPTYISHFIILHLTPHPTVSTKDNDYVIIYPKIVVHYMLHVSVDEAFRSSQQHSKRCCPIIRLAQPITGQYLGVCLSVRWPNIIAYCFSWWQMIGLFGDICEHFLVWMGP